MRNLEDEWSRGDQTSAMQGPFNGLWTGWAEFEVKDEGMDVAPSSPVKRKAENEHDEEDQQPTQHRQVSPDQDEEMKEISEISSDLDVTHQLNEVLRAVKVYGANQQGTQAHVSEACSPVRVTGMAEKMGLILGLAMDLTTCDQHGNPWDFNVHAMRVKAKKIIKSKSALLLIVSPMCAAFSRLQTFNFKRLGAERVKQMLDYGIKHLTFAMELCEIQRRNGLYFLFEHPAGATRWSTSTVQRILRNKDVKVYNWGMCCYDLKQMVKAEEMYIKKPTKFMTNSPAIGRELSWKCKGQQCHMESTGGGRTHRSEAHPDRPCRAILKGLMEQMQIDGRQGGTLKEDEPLDMEVDSEEHDHMQIDDVNWACDEIRENREYKCQLTWTRSDYGTSRLMLPGPAGPLWSACSRRVTRDLDTGRIIEDREVSEMTGIERRRMFRKGPVNIATTFTYEVVGEAAPHKWRCERCDHEGWIKVPHTCPACESVGAVRPMPMNSINV
eukprot:5916182-Pyramimonas_sp.AAC.1